MSINIFIFQIDGVTAIIVKQPAKVEAARGSTAFESLLRKFEGVFIHIQRIKIPLMRTGFHIRGLFLNGCYWKDSRVFRCA